MPKISRESTFKNFDYIFISELYLNEIISGMKMITDMSLFSFMKLFDSQVKLIDINIFNILTNFLSKSVGY